jgi:hypothetical protein
MPQVVEAENAPHAQENKVRKIHKKGWINSATNLVAKFLRKQPKKQKMSKLKFLSCPCLARIPGR